MGHFVNEPLRKMGHIEILHFKTNPQENESFRNCVTSKKITTKMKHFRNCSVGRILKINEFEVTYVTKWFTFEAG